MSELMLNSSGRLVDSPPVTTFSQFFFLWCHCFGITVLKIGYFHTYLKQTSGNYTINVFSGCGWWCLECRREARSRAIWHENSLGRRGGGKLRYSTRGVTQTLPTTVPLPTFYFAITDLALIMSPANITQPHRKTDKTRAKVKQKVS